MLNITFGDSIQEYAVWELKVDFNAEMVGKKSCLCDYNGGTIEVKKVQLLNC